MGWGNFGKEEEATTPAEMTERRTHTPKLPFSELSLALTWGEENHGEGEKERG